MFNTTICALATARLNCAIHIIRISGPSSFSIINKILNKPINYEGNKIFHRLIIDNDEKIDDVLINSFVQPKSYTGEDVIEINCHGGVLIADKILQILIKHGCVYATRGEFTKRALFNKKLDLSQSQAINNLIHAQNNIGLKGSINALLGVPSKSIQKARDALFELIGQIEVNIDYPEYEDIIEITSQNALEITNNLIKELEQILIDSNRFININNGIKVIIFGEPNAGKSTLLNAMTNSNKAIISNIPGTTRDVIEASVTIDDITLNLYDTAGIRETTDELERLGIEKAHEILKIADLVLILQPINKNDPIWLDNTIKLIGSKKYIIVRTKADLLNTKIKLSTNEVLINAKDNLIDPLIYKIKEYFEVNELLDSNMNVLQSSQHIGLLANAIERLKEARQQILTDPLDLIIELYNLALSSLNKILGIDYNYDFLDELFNKFCLGK
ncbi:MAG: tRNA uridine-5-carboxymethylaminomethyl(34) synthesis GTPase MnmE [Ureaplasma sp.]|nr:tRNA uridine-5-carboxymethylaminomethyl(34) synthesis GTPase MnmE [Ureaplasma sp.]MDE7221680.1 tRNA uridine-5-carboxymethylaminomethyl(34) synthesis GTPase MnmE [Ureaplasma sp.]